MNLATRCVRKNKTTNFTCTSDRIGTGSTSKQRQSVTEQHNRLHKNSFSDFFFSFLVFLYFNSVRSEMRENGRSDKPLKFSRKAIKSAIHIELDRNICGFVWPRSFLKKELLLRHRDGDKRATFNRKKLTLKQKSKVK